MMETAANQRVIVTGSRDWPDPAGVGRTLSALRKTIVFVHGDCPTGADRAVREWCEANGVQHEPHPADWERHGRAAGPIRNQEMVDLGADLCLAFPQGESRGTRDCMRRAEAAGIRVVNVADRTPDDAGTFALTPEAIWYLSR